MKTITIIGAGMMGSALAFPARENGNTVRLVGTPLDREIIETSIRTNRHPKFNKDFPAGLKYYQIEDMMKAVEGADMIIGGVSSFGVDWFGDVVLPKIPENIPVITVTKGLRCTVHFTVYFFCSVCKGSDNAVFSGQKRNKTVTFARVCYSEHQSVGSHSHVFQPPKGLRQQCYGIQDNPLLRLFVKIFAKPAIYPFYRLPFINYPEKAGFIDGRKRNLIQTEIMNKTFSVAPALFNLNPALKVDFALEKVFHISSCS